MKKIYLALAILILFPALTGLHLYYTERKCRELAEVVGLAAEDAGDSEELLKKAEEMWHRLEKGVGISANHSIVEKINESFNFAKSWQKLGETSMLTSELNRLESLVRHIYEMEYPTAYNIF